MIDVKQRFEEAKQAYRNAIANGRLDLIVYLAGVSGFVGFTALVILICNNCTQATTLKEFFSGSVSFWGALFSAFMVLVLWICVFLVFRRYMRKHLGDVMETLIYTASRLAGEPEGNKDNGLVPQMKEQLESMGKITTYLVDLVVTESLAQKHLIAYDTQPEKALESIICSKALIEAESVKDVRIAGTMRGVCGNGTFSMDTHIREYAKKRFDACGKKPFERLMLLAPNPNTIANHENLYPMCARHFALKVLLGLIKICEGLSTQQQNAMLPVEVSLSYTGIDIFPAWQLWCDECLVIVPSLGYSDKDLLSALPIGIIAKSSSDAEPAKLAATFIRLAKHFDDRFTRGVGKGKEKFELAVKGSGLSVSATGVWKSISNAETDKMIRSKFPKWGPSGSTAKSFEMELSPTEVAELATLLNELIELRLA